MPLTFQQLLRQLDVDEPDYSALKALGPEAVPLLAILVKGDDPGVAAKAAYLASLIESDDALDVVSAAAASPHETVRVAAGAGLRNLHPAQALTTAERLLDDADVGVRKQAIRAVAELGIAALEPKLKSLSERDPEPGLRVLAKQGLRRILDIRAELAENPAAVPDRPASQPRRRRSRKQHQQKKTTRKKTVGRSR